MGHANPQIVNPPDGEQSSGNDIEALCFLSHFPVFLSFMIFCFNSTSSRSQKVAWRQIVMLPPNHNLSSTTIKMASVKSPAKKNSQRRRSTSAGDGYAVHSSAALAAADAADAIARAAANASHAGRLATCTCK